jgi:hypothetical protein
MECLLLVSAEGSLNASHPMQIYLLFDVGFIGTSLAFVVDPSDGHRVAF